MDNYHKTKISIKSIDDYEETLERIGELMDAAPGSPEEQELEHLVALIERYEEEHYPIDPPDPEAARRFRAEQEADLPATHNPTEY